MVGYKHKVTIKGMYMPVTLPLPLSNQSDRSPPIDIGRKRWIDFKLAKRNKIVCVDVSIRVWIGSSKSHAYLIDHLDNATLVYLEDGIKGRIDHGLCQLFLPLHPFLCSLFARKISNKACT